MVERSKPHYTLHAEALAEWVERQPDKWWVVDGDPLLTSLVDFPCPSDELAPVIRNIGKDLLLRDKVSSSNAGGELIASDRLDALCDTGDRYRQKALRLSWKDSGIDWLLIEDKAAVRQ
jgi:hypothetical protein